MARHHTHRSVKAKANTWDSALLNSASEGSHDSDQGLRASRDAAMPLARRSRAAAGKEVSSMQKKVTWILVADGARARVLMNDGAGKGLQPMSDGELTHSLPPTRELGTRPPRAHTAARPQPATGHPAACGLASIREGEVQQGAGVAARRGGRARRLSSPGTGRAAAHARRPAGGAGDEGARPSSMPRSTRTSRTSRLQDCPSHLADVVAL